MLKASVGAIGGAVRATCAVVGIMLACPATAALKPDLVLESLDRSALTWDHSETIDSSGRKGVRVTGTVSASTRLRRAAVTRAVTVLFFEDADRNGEYSPIVDVRLCEAALPSPALDDVTTAQCVVDALVSFAHAPVTALVDPARVVRESDESNNILVSGSERVPAGPARPIDWTLADPVKVGGSTEGQREVMMTPVIAQLDDDDGNGRVDGDDDVDVLWSRWATDGQYDGAYLRWVSGRALETAPTRAEDVPQPLLGGALARVATAVSPAVGDLDGDGFAEIVAVSDTRRVYCFNAGLELLWIGTGPDLPGRADIPATVAIVNVDGVGAPEVVVGAMLYSATGQFLADGLAAPHSGTPPGFPGDLSSAQDIDRDGLPEIVAGATAYRYRNGALSVAWRRTDIGDTWVGVGNLDDDSYAEIVLVSPGDQDAPHSPGIIVLDHDGSACESWNPAGNHGWVPLYNNSWGSGPPTIADLDGDGFNEIAVVAYGSHVDVFDRTGAFLWMAPHQDTSGFTSLAAFDFDMDGASELVVRDNVKVRILAGAPSAPQRELAVFTSCSGTGWESPAIGDIDADGRAEILVGAGDAGSGVGACEGQDFGLLAFRQPSWAGARASWNEFDYHVSNVGDDGAIPMREPRRWQQEEPGDLRRQVSPRGISIEAPDLTASRMVLVPPGCDVGTVTVRVGNGGGQRSGPTQAVLRNDVGGQLEVLGSPQSVPSLPIGASVVLTFDVPTGVLLGDLSVTADDDGTGAGSIDESHEDNNSCRLPAGRDCEPPSIERRPTLLTLSNTTATLSGAYTEDYLDPVEVAALLQDTSVLPLQPVAGEMVDFVLGGAANCRAVTDVDGWARCWLRVHDTSTNVQLVARTPQTTRWDAAGDVEDFAITPEQSALTFAAPLVQPSIGKSMSVAAKLWHDHAVGLGGQQIKFTSGIQEQTKLTTVNGLQQGQASHQFVETDWGPHAVTTTFDGDPVGFEDASLATDIHLIGPQVSLDPARQVVAPASVAVVQLSQLAAGTSWIWEGGDLPVRYAINGAVSAEILLGTSPVNINVTASAGNGSDLVVAWIDLDHDGVQEAGERSSVARVDHPVRKAVTITCTPSPGDCHDTTAVTAHVSDTAGNVTLAPVTMKLGTTTCQAITNGSGDATCWFTPPTPTTGSGGGSADLKITYGGDPERLPATWDVQDFVIEVEETRLAMATVTPLRQTGNPTLPTNVLVRARLTEDGGLPLVGETVTFTTSLGTWTDATDATGLAEQTVTLAPGASTVNGSYSGSPCHASATATATIIVVTGTGDPIPNLNPATMPGPPTNVTAAVKGDGAVEVSFNQPSNADTKFVQGYFVEVSDSSERHALSRAEANTSTPSKRVVTGLGHGGTGRTFRVVAANDLGYAAGSTSGWTSPAVTPVVIPGAPPTITATLVNGTIEVIWTPADDGGSAPLEYDVMAIEEGIVRDVDSSLTWTMTNIQEQPSWTFAARARNAVGAGPWTAPTAPITFPAAPGVPFELCATTTPGQVQLWWMAPADRHGVSVDHYEYAIDGGGWTSFGAGRAVHGSLALPNGVVSTVQLRAAASGSGPYGDSTLWPQVTVKPAGPPAAPTLASTSKGNAAIATSWTASTGNGLTLAGHVIQADDGSLQVFDAVLPADVSGVPLQRVVPEFENGTVQIVSVATVDERGQVSSFSGTDVATPSREPDRPTVVQAARIGSGEIELTWVPPVDKGHEILDGYLISAVPDIGVVNANSVTSTQISGLVNGRAYIFFVRATNADYPEGGVESDASNVVTPWGQPGKPRGVTPSPSGPGTLRLTWLPPEDDGGYELTGHEYRFRAAPSGTWSAWFEASSPVEMPNADTGPLTIGAEYDFQVRAKSAAPSDNIGSEAPTALEVPARARVIDLPDAPTVASLLAGDGGLTVSWTSIANGSEDAGYTEIIGYHACPLPADGDCIDVPADVAVATLDELANGKSYRVTVQARNVLGLGPAGELMEGGVPATRTPCGVPSDPLRVRTSVTGNGELTVEWDPPAADGGCGILSYLVQPSVGSDQTVLATDPRVAVFTGYAACQAVSFTVTAHNSVGWGASSDPVTGIAAGPPDPPLEIAAVGGDGRARACWSLVPDPTRVPPGNPHDNGCSPVLEFEVRALDGGTVVGTAGPVPVNQTCASVTSLTNGQSYDIEVRARNLAGWGAWGPAASPVTPAAAALQDIIAPDINEGGVALGTVRLTADTAVDFDVEVEVADGPVVLAGPSVIVTVPAGESAATFPITAFMVAGTDEPYHLRKVGEIVEFAGQVLESGDVLPCAVDFITPTSDEEVTDFNTAFEAEILCDSPGITPHWTVTLSLADGGGVEYTWTGTGAVVQFPLDPTLLLNGQHELHLTADDGAVPTAAALADARHRIVVAGQQKIGHFSLSYVDMTIPAAGIPVQVVRTYDSRDPRDGDFGAGWTLGFSDVRVELTVPLSQEWIQVQHGGLAQFGVTQQCVEETRRHVVSVTFPDGRVYRFKPTFSREEGSVQPCAWWEAEEGFMHYVPMGSARAKLRSVQGDAVDFDRTAGTMHESDGNIGVTGIEFVRDEFVLTTEDGRQWTVKVGAGLSRVMDRNNNDVTFTPSGISANGTPLVTLVRNDGVHVDQVIDPSGNHLAYWRTAGNLTTVEDRVQVLSPAIDHTLYSYGDAAHPHFVTDIEQVGSSANAPAPVVTTYVNGRVSTICQAGNCVNLGSRDLVVHTQTITDARNNSIVLTYDARGRVVLKNDADGDWITEGLNPGDPAYTDDDQPIRERTPRPDQLTENTYEDAQAGGNVIATTNALDETTAYTWTDDDLLTSVTPPDGTKTTYTHDSRGNIATVTDALNHATLTVANAQGDVEYTQDALGHETRATWSGGLLVTETDASGATTEHVHDNNGNVIETIRQSEDGDLLTRMEHDAEGRVIRTEGPGGSVSETQYDAFGRVTLERELLDAHDPDDPNDDEWRETETRYDEYGRARFVIERWNGHETVEESEHDVSGNLVMQRSRTRILGWNAPDDPDYDPADVSVVTRHAYDELNRLVKTCVEGVAPSFDMTDLDWELGCSVSCTNVERGVSWQRDERGNVSVTEEDLAGRPERRCGPFEMDATEQVNPATISCNGHSVGLSVTVYAPLTGRVLWTIETVGPAEPPGAQVDVYTVPVHDAAGRRVAECRMLAPPDPDFDLDDALAAQASATDDITCRTFELDALGRTVAERDANGHETRFSHDESGRLVGVTQWPDAAGAPSLAFLTSYGFDDRGNMVTQEDALGRLTRYGFDEARRRTSRTLPLLQRETLTHAADGSLQSRRSFGGALTEHERGHDLAGHRQDVVHLPPGETDIVTTYWGDGQRHVVTDSSGTTTHGRDLTTGRLTSITRDEAATGGLDSTITYGHDLSGNVTSIATSVDGNPAHVVTRDHDAAGRITKVGDALGRAEYEYTPSGQLYRVKYFQAAATEPFVVGEYEHDALTGGIQSITWRAGESSPGVPGPVLRSFTYVLDEMGRRTAATETQAGGGTRVVTWTSDDLYRLESELVTEADLSQWAVTYGYDRVGNRLARVRTGTDPGSVAYAYDANDRLLAVNEQDYDWDAEGNLSSRDGSDDYDWDAQDRLTGIEGWSFVYDANGLKRVATSPDGTVTTEVVDETFPHAQVIEERWSEGPASRVKRYLRGVQPVRIDVGGQSWWYLHDALGSTRALVQPGGSLDATVVTDEWDYQAFGEVAREWHAATGACGEQNRWLYAGEERVEGIGLDYLRARWMEPGVGRFGSRDRWEGEMRRPGTKHGYAYAEQGPTWLVDPSGRLGIDGMAVFSLVALGPVGGHAPAAASDAPTPLQSAKLELARAVAIAMVDNAMRLIDLTPPWDGVQPLTARQRHAVTWFGHTNLKDRLGELQSRWNVIAQVIRHLDFRVEPLPPAGEDALMWARGQGNGTYEVVAYRSWFRLPIFISTQEDSQVGTVIHEAAHIAYPADMNDMKSDDTGTIYSYAEAQYLAAGNYSPFGLPPEWAMYNAANYEWYALNSPLAP